MRNLTLLKYLPVLLLALGGQAWAHGDHYQLDVTSHLQEDASGQLTGVRMNWFYDAGVTKMLLEGEDISAGKRVETLQEIATRAIADLGKLNYYTQLSLAGQPLSLAPVTDYHMDLLPDGHLNLNFLLPLASPQDLAGKRLDIALADSAGSAILMYQDASRIRLGEKMGATCTSSLEDRPKFADGEPPQFAHVQCR